MTSTCRRVLRTSAALGWRFLVVVAALYVIGTVAGYLAAVVVPVAIALLLAALLAPAVHWLQVRNVPRGVATMLVMVGGLALVGGVLTFVVVTFVRGVPDLGNQLTASVDAVVAWLTNGPLKLSEAQLRGYQDQLLATVSANQASITAGAITTAATVGEIVTETLLVVFTLIFFLQGGGEHLAVPARRGARRSPGRGPTSPAGGRWPRWSATCGRPRWWPWWTRWPSGSGWPCWACRWPCRWPPWSSSARSSRSSARCSPAASRCSSRWSPRARSPR